VTRCREFGIVHSHGHAIRWETREIVPTETEAQFFALAQVECLPPEERDALADLLVKGGSSHG